MDKNKELKRRKKYKESHRKELAEKARARYRLKAEEIKKKVRAYGQSHKEQHNAHQREYYRLNKLKFRARDMAGDHKKEIKKEKCEICGSTKKLEMHHENYDKRLDVRTLCFECHAMIHRKYPEEYKLPPKENA